MVCFQAMKESGVKWPLITEDDQDRQMKRYVTTVKFGMSVAAYSLTGAVPAVLLMRSEWRFGVRCISPSATYRRYRRLGHGSCVGLDYRGAPA